MVHFHVTLNSILTIFALFVAFAQSCNAQVNFATAATSSTALFTSAFYQLLVRLRYFWQCCPQRFPLSIIIYPTPLLRTRNGWCSFKRLSPNMTCLDAFACWIKALCVGGILSNLRDLRVNNSILASLTFMLLLVLSYIKTTKRSSKGIHSSKKTS